MPLIAVTVATLLALVLAWGPLARALGIGGAGSAASCERMHEQARRLCRGLSAEPACREALTATADCEARAAILGACEAP